MIQAGQVGTKSIILSVELLASAMIPPMAWRNPATTKPTATGVTFSGEAGARLAVYSTGTIGATGAIRPSTSTPSSRAPASRRLRRGEFDDRMPRAMAKRASSLVDITSSSPSIRRWNPSSLAATPMSERGQRPSSPWVDTRRSSSSSRWISTRMADSASPIIRTVPVRSVFTFGRPSSISLLSVILGRNCPEVMGSFRYR